MSLNQIITSLNADGHVDVPAGWTQGRALFGGLLGLLLGYLFAALIAFSLPSMPGALVPLWAIGLSFGFTSLIGLVFGLAPAVKAARLQPIDALRYE